MAVVANPVRQEEPATVAVEPDAPRRAREHPDQQRFENRARIEKVLPLSRAAEAHSIIEAGMPAGKIVLDPTLG